VESQYEQSDPNSTPIWPHSKPPRLRMMIPQTAVSELRIGFA
jgi:hypothetical protein